MPMAPYAASPTHERPPTHQHPPPPNHHSPPTHPPPHRPNAVNPTGQEWISGDPYLDACVCGTTCTCRKGYRVLYRQRHENGNTEAGEIRYVAKDTVGRNCDGSGVPGVEIENKEKERKRKKKERRQREKEENERMKREHDDGPTRSEILERMQMEMEERLAQLEDMAGGGGELPPPGPGLSGGGRGGRGPPRGGPPYGGGYPEMMSGPPGYDAHPPKPNYGPRGNPGGMRGGPDGPMYSQMPDMADEYPPSDISFDNPGGCMKPRPYGMPPGGRRGGRPGPPGMQSMPFPGPVPEFQGGHESRAFGGGEEFMNPGGGRRGGTGMGIPPGMGGFAPPFMQEPKGGRRSGKKGRKGPKLPKGSFFPPTRPVMNPHMGGGAGPVPDLEGPQPDPEADWEEFDGT